MKKALSIIISCIILSLTLLPVTAFAWATPSLQLNTTYNEKKKEITVEYYINDFAGTESADLILRYDSDVVEYVECKTAKMSNSIIEADKVVNEDKIAIVFANMYYVEPDACDENGGMAIAEITFRVTDESAAETVFIATTESYAMDPDSTRVTPSRFTQKFSLSGEDTSDTASEQTDSKNITKIIIAAAVTLAVFIGGMVAIVIRYRKK